MSYFADSMYMCFALSFLMYRSQIWSTRVLVWLHSETFLWIPCLIPRQLTQIQISKPILSSERPGTSAGSPDCHPSYYKRKRSFGARESSLPVEDTSPSPSSWCFSSRWGTNKMRPGNLLAFAICFVLNVVGVLAVTGCSCTGLVYINSGKTGSQPANTRIVC